MRNILERADKFLCIYLGLKSTKIVPQIVEKKRTQLKVWHTESFKRHVHKVLVNKINLKMIDDNNKEKLGIAIGKMIASNVVVSFDEIVIKKD